LQISECLWILTARGGGDGRTLGRAALFDHLCFSFGAASTTLDAIRAFAAARPTIYLPAHDPDAAQRLAERRVTGSPVLAEASTL